MGICMKETMLICHSKRNMCTVLGYAPSVQFCSIERFDIVDLYPCNSLHREYPLGSIFPVNTGHIKSFIACKVAPNTLGIMSFIGVIQLVPQTKGKLLEPALDIIISA